MSIDALIERMEALLGPLQEAGDARRFFHATYLRTTRAVRDALRAGLFSDPQWVERWDVAFADRYLDALTADSGGAAVPKPWAVAFRAAREQPSAPALRHVLLGMNAHINYDLPQALLAVISPGEFADPAVTARRRADHQRIDEVLSRQVGAEDAELARAGAPPSRTDVLLGLANRAASRRFLRESRAKVWHNAVLLNAARARGPAAYAERLRDLEDLSAARVTELVRPGQVLLRLASRGFGVRLRGPAGPATSEGPGSDGPGFAGAGSAGAPRTSRPSRLMFFRPGARSRPGIPRLGRLLPAGLAGGTAGLSRPGPGRVRDGLAADPARGLAGAAGQPAVGAWPTTTRTARGAACAASMACCGSATASPGTWPRRPAGKLTGGEYTASASTPRTTSTATTSWSIRWSGCTRSCTANRRRRSGPLRCTAPRPWTSRTSGWPKAARPDSPLLAREHAALVRSYAALLAAVHH